MQYATEFLVFIHVLLLFASISVLALPSRLNAVLA